jgi:hypothetical protein
MQEADMQFLHELRDEELETEGNKESYDEDVSAVEDGSDQDVGDFDVTGNDCEDVVSNDKNVPNEDVAALNECNCTLNEDDALNEVKSVD